MSMTGAWPASAREVVSASVAQVETFSASSALIAGRAGDCGLAAAAPGSPLAAKGRYTLSPITAGYSFPTQLPARSQA